MEFFRIRSDIPFMRHALVLNAISFLTFAAAVFFLATRGLHLSIEFTGGTVIEVQYAQAADIDKTRARGRGAGPRRGAGAELRHLARRADPPAGARRRQAGRRWPARVFDALCQAEGGTRAHQGTTPRRRASGQPAGLRRGRRHRAAAAAAHRVRRPVGRRRAGRATAPCALAVTIVGIMIYLALRFEWKFSVAGDRRQPARRGHHPGLLRLLPVGVLAGGAGGGAGGAGLFGQRVGGHLRPHPRVLPQVPQAEHRRRSSTTPSPAPSAAPSSPTARPR